ncbi:phosphocholine-specific phospholipase C [Wenjunlia tyrosinilytica]|uniref:phospholipase C n=1 Tax=Wenjunlia tyrosinilytica TaxID=1544741 RepID=A0A917ZUL1_9ACTN|nr:phospholipase C, phosphocholine-specific [Wenjunlia tyrosinilytica]GGO92989.1 phospholipase C, phosphocholine-specific [Wenjunlia tyrosinilytica]
MSPDFSRRRLLAAGAGTAGAAAAASVLPPSLQAALAAEPARGGLGAIKHVVLLMQENRSFDHLFGTLRGVRGFSDRNAIALPGTGGTPGTPGKPVFEQPADPGRTVLPFPVRGAAETQKKDLQYIGALDHSWDGGNSAWHGGWMDNWISAKSAATMAYYDRRDVPLHYELADTFTICDAYHSSIHSSTSPNRNHWVSGWTGYEADGERAVDNDAYDEDTHPGYTWPTYAERLEKAGRTWKVYQEWDNYQDNNLEFYATFKAVARKALAKAGDFKSLDSFYSAVFKANPTEQERLLGLLEDGVKALSKADRGLYERALRRGRPHTLAEDFRADVAAGRLPEVTYLVPSAADSEHPSASSPIASATITYQVLDALASHPEVWRHTAVFITYDENDGFFDHVPPPVPSSQDPHGKDEIWKGRPTGLGVRVPLLVVSPWTVGGYACSEVFDHTSQIRFLEKWLGIEEPNITPWRRQVTGDLTSAFDFKRGRGLPELDRPGPVPPFTGRWNPAPPADQRMPAQEPGTRRARPLPYQPNAQGHVDGGTFRLTLTNTGRSSVHFALYPYAGEFTAPQHQDVRRKGVWQVPLPGERYNFTVTGPNGFRREFAGSRDGCAEVCAHIDAGDRVVHLTLSNHGDDDAVFTLHPNAYAEDRAARARHVPIKAGKSRTIAYSADRDHGWYDVTLTTPADPAFHRRLMGHIENGGESVTG